MTIAQLEASGDGRTVFQRHKSTILQNRSITKRSPPLSHGYIRNAITVEYANSNKRSLVVDDWLGMRSG